MKRHETDSGSASTMTVGAKQSAASVAALRPGRLPTAGAVLPEPPATACGRSRRAGGRPSPTSRPARRLLPGRSGGRGPACGAGSGGGRCLGSGRLHLSPGAGGRRSTRRRVWQRTSPSMCRGMTTAGAGGGTGLGLTLAGVRPGDLWAPEPAALVTGGARIDYLRGPVTEWWLAQRPHRDLDRRRSVPHRRGLSETRRQAVPAALLR